ncbi:hypothetical protein WR25_12698 isoform B [Diploscapter pachys]|uniref:Uncharacterized protein n=1 Tax=Diploscapter pachys TaxID=2018661 RepID=A0A2A2LM09_9BILA|nr:hypothetical protein WR25_12698 isoform B [Diploscapter pachys]
MDAKFSIDCLLQASCANPDQQNDESDLKKNDAEANSESSNYSPNSSIQDGSKPTTPAMVGQNPAAQFLNSLNYQLLSQQLAAQMAQAAAATVGQQQQSGGAGPSTLPPGTLPNGILDAQIWEACKVVYSYFSGYRGEE